MNSLEKEYIYGINPVFETLLAERRKIYGAFFNQALLNKNQRLMKLRRLLEEKEINLNFVEKGRLIDRCGSRENQGVVLEVSPYNYARFDDMLNEKRLLLLDNIEDPRNLGAILRSAETFGFNNILLPTKGTPEVYPSVVKSSAGASEHLRISRSRGANQYVKRAKENGFSVLALDSGGSLDLNEVKKGDWDKMLLVIGGEDKSVGQFILNEAEVVVRIPRQGRIDSLNASVAAGVAMYALA